MGAIGAAKHGPCSDLASKREEIVFRRCVEDTPSNDWRYSSSPSFQVEANFYGRLR